ncbi:MAG: thioesterase [Eubacteriales bacterium]|nr:thioesterase [Eubacteriales bacterium]MDD3863214.1 thioesterase [Eubacteriales bacterium]MDD4445420.1 thioesterase [Eubacteriales bacterium]
MKLDHEQSNLYTIQLDPSLLNPRGILKPQAYQSLYCELAEQHLTAHDAGSDKTLKYGVAWVLISLSVDVFKPAVAPGALQAKTWKSGRKGPYFMRDFIFSTKDGELCFRGTSYSVLLNLDTRKICRDKNIPFFSLTADEPPLTLGQPTWKHAYGQEAEPIADGLTLRTQRKVENSFLDLLGHVNNTRYAEFVYDAMTEEEVERLNGLSRMEVYFAAELRHGDTFFVSAVEKSDRLFFRGSKDGSGETSFDLVFYL